MHMQRIGKVNWVGSYTLYMRECRRFLKVYQQTVLAPAFTTLTFLLVISIAFDGNSRNIKGLNFIDFLAPGLIVMTMVQNAFANTSSSLISSKVAGNIVDILMPPLNAHELTFSYFLGAVTRSMLVGIVTTLAMLPFINIGVTNIFILIFFALSGSIFLGLLGLITGVWAEKFDNMSAVTNFIVTPLTFLSGTFYSIDKLPEPFYSLCFLNPFFYIIDGFRSSMIEHRDSNILVGIVYLTTLNVLLYILSWYIFKKGWHLRF